MSQYYTCCNKVIESVLREKFTWVFDKKYKQKGNYIESFELLNESTDEVVGYVNIETYPRRKIGNRIVTFYEDWAEWVGYCHEWEG